MSEKMAIDVWSDVMCPFCYIGDTVLEQALEKFEHNDQVEVRYHSYQLMPELGTEPANLSKLLGERYTPAQLDAQNEHMKKMGQELGIEFNFDKAVTVNTFKAHRLSQFAAANGKGREMIRLLFKAYFSDGKNVAENETLANLAVEAGLDYNEALLAAESDLFTDEVNADIGQARQIGFGGVPFFIFNNKYGVSGAQPLQVFEQTLATAWAER